MTLYIFFSFLTFMMIVNNDNFIESEFSDIELGDKRLSERLIKIAHRFNADPKQSIPSLCRGEDAELKAAYRFFRNEKVTDQKLLEVHYKNTVDRCLDYSGKILLLSDSTFVSPSKWFEGLKTHGKGHENCLRIHYVLAVSFDKKIIFGMLDFRTISDNLSKTSITLKDESDIWLLVAKSSVDRILSRKDARSAGLLNRCVYETDREGDEYDLMIYLHRIGLGFTIRSQHDRVINYRGIEDKISTFDSDQILHGSPYEIQVKTSTGKMRTAKVQRSVLKKISILPPEKQKNEEEIENINLVFITEIDSDVAYKDQVQWRLITTDPADNKHESDSVVEDYKVRWVIEEMNKCAKSGAGAEDRQFQHIDHFKPFLALTYVVAWRILAIRTISDQAGDTLIESVFSQDEVDYFETVSRKRDDEDKIKTVAQAMQYISKEGGFTRSYKKVGWIILWRGWIKFTYFVHGHALAKEDFKT